jgi:hypothetical protein
MLEKPDGGCSDVISEIVGAHRMEFNVDDHHADGNHQQQQELTDDQQIDRSTQPP